MTDSENAKTIVLTGASDGIGAAAARQLTRDGHHVVLIGRSPEKTRRIGEELDSPFFVADYADLSQVRALAAQLREQHPRIDVLINNAGGTRMGPLETIPTRGWDSIFELNVRSAYVATREAGKHMMAQQSGAIVNISSGAGIRGVRGGAHYSAAKSALQMFTTVTAAEWGKYGIRANCVAAGAISSERVLEAWKVAGLEAEAMGAAIPLRRTGTPDEMANMIVFLASDAASYITGQTVAVDGGPTLGGIPDE